MQVFIFALLGLLLLKVLLSGKAKTETDYIVESKAKQCPPHEWEYQDVKDNTGEVQGQRMVCKKCGPYSRLLGLGDV
jgi:hypothetical protein